MVNIHMYHELHVDQLLIVHIWNLRNKYFSYVLSQSLAKHTGSLVKKVFPFSRKFEKLDFDM